LQVSATVPDHRMDSTGSEPSRWQRPPPLRAACPPGHTPQGSHHFLLFLQVRPPTRVSAIKTRMDNRQIRTKAGGKRWPPMGEIYWPISGDFRWPPLGRFPWPPSSGSARTAHQDWERRTIEHGVPRCSQAHAPVRLQKAACRPSRARRTSLALRVDRSLRVSLSHLRGQERLRCPHGRPDDGLTRLRAHASITGVTKVRNPSPSRRSAGSMPPPIKS
jgi:hypothetical protein